MKRADQVHGFFKLPAEARKTRNYRGKPRMPGQITDQDRTELPRAWGNQIRRKSGPSFSNPAEALCHLKEGAMKVTLISAGAAGLFVGGPAVAQVAGDNTTATPTHARAASWDPIVQPDLSYRAHGEAVERLQTRLTELGYRPGAIDGSFGPKVRSALVLYQRDRGLRMDGKVDQQDWAALAAGQRTTAGLPRTTPGGVPILDQYEPRSATTIRLFREAATLIGAPQSWAESRGLHRLLSAESNGWVGRPNYTYGLRFLPSRHDQWARIHSDLMLGIRSTSSSATGLGQLLIANVDIHYPSGRRGIGNPLEEAAGMLSYIRDRYGNPDNAWRQYNDHHEGY